MTNPSLEYMRQIRREEQAKLLDMRRERAVKALRSLDLNGGSHAMLSQIAYAIHPHVGAWDAESCDHLRTVLAELIGGDHEAVSGNQRHCACGVGGCHRGDESEAVGGQSRTCPESEPDVSESDDGMSVTSELREYVDTYLMHNTTLESEKWLAMTGRSLLAMADRIDEQFAEYQRVVEALALVHHGTLAAYKRLEEKFNE